MIDKNILFHHFITEKGVSIFKYSLQKTLITIKLFSTAQYRLRDQKLYSHNNKDIKTVGNSRLVVSRDCFSQLAQITKVLTLLTIANEKGSDITMNGGFSLSALAT